MKKKEYWITNSRFKLIVIILVCLWLGVMLFLYLKTDEITKNPCQICAKKIGENVVCTISGSFEAITFHPDYTIEKNFNVGEG